MILKTHFIESTDGYESFPKTNGTSKSDETFAKSYINIIEIYLYVKFGGINLLFYFSMHFFQH